MSACPQSACRAPRRKRSSDLGRDPAHRKIFEPVSLQLLHPSLQQPLPQGPLLLFLPHPVFHRSSPLMIIVLFYRFFRRKSNRFAAFHEITEKRELPIDTPVKRQYSREKVINDNPSVLCRSSPAAAAASRRHSFFLFCWLSVITYCLPGIPVWALQSKIWRY